MNRRISNGRGMPWDRKRHWAQMDKSARTMEEWCAYLSANFERGSQLSVFVGMFRFGFKPAILVGVEEKRIPSGGGRRRKPDEGVVRVRWEGGSLMASHDCNVSLPRQRPWQMLPQRKPPPTMSKLSITSDRGFSLPQHCPCLFDSSFAQNPYRLPSCPSGYTSSHTYLPHSSPDISLR